ncbi:SURF1 family protein [Arthrobacter sp. MP_2.3]|uniref:SURF1 family protein n=1 Tax=Arthrobacter sp. MP_2.3 TaxID=3349633 RepID=UPI0038D35C98
MLKTALKPRWIAGLVFAIVVSGVFVLLSQWQFGRSTQSEVTVSTTTEEPKPLTTVLQPGGFFPGSVADQVVTVTGTYDPQKQILVPGRLHDGARGYWVVAALAVENAPALTGAGATPQTWIPVARGWVADPADASAPPSGSVELTGRLLPSEAPVPGTDAGPGKASAVSVAELINIWEVSSYPGFVAASSETAGGSDVSASASVGAFKPLNIGPQPPAEKVNWLNLFYAAEWVVFAGFALFIWWRLVKDDYRRSLEDALDEEQEAAQLYLSEPDPADQHPTDQHPTEPKVQS